MRKLWKILPPLMADNFGFIETIRQTDGVGIIDDCGEYRLGRERRGGPDIRVCHTKIASEDVVSGTRQKVLDTFEELQQRYHASFVLLSAGPCSAMIGTDLDEAAEQITKESGLPAIAVKLSGHKTYDEGISETLYGMASLLCEEQGTIPGSVNLLGANTFDLQTEMPEQIRGWFEAQGIHVIANFGGKETAENIKKAPAAAMNVVLTVSGLKAAKYLYQQFGTPYLAMAPFGKKWCELLLEGIQNKEQPKAHASMVGDAQVLIIGEQLMANAIRETLTREYGMERVQVATFYKLARELAEPQDVRIRDEEEAQELLGKSCFRLVIADPLLRLLAPNEVKWVDLPHNVFSLYGKPGRLPSLLGKQLNEWLEKEGTGVRK